MRYTDSHEWIDLKDEVATVGITSYAQKELGEIVYIELPKLGQILEAGEELAILESTKAAADIYIPATGEIIEINAQLAENPALLNHAPESEGWICKLKLQDVSQLEKLLTKEAYAKLIGQSGSTSKEVA